MSRTFTPRDGYALMNALVKQATGQTNITVADASDFVSAGELVLATGMENTLNSLSIVMGRTLMAVRPYQAKLRIINALNTDLYTSRLRKISVYSDDAQAAGDWNTQVATNLADGFDNGTNGGQSVGSMWEQKQVPTLEMNFGGQTVWDDQITIYENQLKVAFRSAEEFAAFMNGLMTEKGNDIESQKEAWNRLAILEKIGQVYDMSANMPGSVVNLTKKFNDTFGTSYTSAQLRTTYLTEFLEFFTAEFKLASDYMTNRSANYHWSPAKSIGQKNFTLLRHTPKDRQRTILYGPLFTYAKAKVFPEIFNPSYLANPEQGETVTYWQSLNNPSAVNVTPAITDVSTKVQVAGANVELDYVVGMLYDVDSLMTDFQYEDSLSSPVEARKRYRNIFWHFSKNIIADPTENCIIFIMKDED